MTEAETKNLSELFREKLRDQWYTKPVKKRNRVRREESGIVGVSKKYTHDYAQGYCFEYKYRTQNQKTKYLYRKNLIDLYELIVNQLHNELIINDKNKARNFIEKYVNNTEEYKILFNKILEV